MMVSGELSSGEKERKKLLALQRASLNWREIGWAYFYGNYFWMSLWALFFFVFFFFFNAWVSKRLPKSSGGVVLSFVVVHTFFAKCSKIRRICCVSFFVLWEIKSSGLGFFFLLFFKDVLKNIYHWIFSRELWLKAMELLQDCTLLL